VRVLTGSLHGPDFINKKESMRMKRNFAVKTMILSLLMGTMVSGNAFANRTINGIDLSTYNFNNGPTGKSDNSSDPVSETSQTSVTTDTYGTSETSIYSADELATIYGTAEQDALHSSSYTPDTATLINGSMQIVGIADSNFNGVWQKDTNGWRYYGDNGICPINGFLTIEGNTYYFDNLGYAVSGWQDLYTSRYYFYTENDYNGGPECAMARDTKIEEVALYPDGTPKSFSTSQEAKATVQALGGTLEAAYNYSVALKYVRSDLSSNKGTRALAHIGFSTGGGNCYVMAATFCEMARALGYPCRQMTGFVPLRRGGLGPHSWTEVYMDGVWRVFDPNMTNETGRNGFNVYYGMPGTWRYQDYSVMHD